MLKGLGEIGQIMKLQKEFKSIQKKLQKTEIEASCADGSVRATVNGEYRLVDIQLSDEALQAERRALEKNIMQAVNAAVEKSKEFAAQEMGRLTGGLNIPGLGDFLK